MRLALINLVLIIGAVVTIESGSDEYCKWMVLGDTTPTTCKTALTDCVKPWTEMVTHKQIHKFIPADPIALKQTCKTMSSFDRCLSNYTQTCGRSGLHPLFYDLVKGVQGMYDVACADGTQDQDVFRRHGGCYQFAVLTACPAKVQQFGECSIVNGAANPGSAGFDSVTFDDAEEERKFCCAFKMLFECNKRALETYCTDEAVNVLYGKNVGVMVKRMLGMDENGNNGVFGLSRCAAYSDTHCQPPTITGNSPFDSGSSSTSDQKQALIQLNTMEPLTIDSFALTTTRADDYVFRDSENSSPSPPPPPVSSGGEGVFLSHVSIVIFLVGLFVIGYIFLYYGYKRFQD